MSKLTISEDFKSPDQAATNNHYLQEMRQAMMDKLYELEMKYPYEHVEIVICIGRRPAIHFEGNPDAMILSNRLGHRFNR